MSSMTQGDLSITGDLNITTGHVSISAGDLHLNGSLHLDGNLIHDLGDVDFSGGNFSVDSSTLFVNKNNNRVGIGTTNPARTLHIQDDNGVLRIDRDTNSPAFILARFPNNDYTTPWKSFIFGVASDSSDNGTFHITDIHTNVGGGGDRRLTIENDGTVGIPGNLVADKIYLQDSGSDYMDWQSGDGVFRFLGGLDVGGTLFASDISGGDWTGATIDATDYVETPLIYNTDGDTLTIQDKLDVTGLINSSVGLEVPEIFNTAGNLKIQPDVQGNVELFGDGDVGNGENGKMFYVRRQAAEGNDYIRFYVSQSRNAYIHSDVDLTLQGQNNFIINAVTKDIFFRMADNAGAKKVYFQDSDNNDLVTIDSNGLLSIDANMGGALNVYRGSNNNIKTFMDSTYTDLRFGGKKDYNRIGTWINKSFQIVTDSTPRITIGGLTGNVGIGTTSPTDQLHLYDGTLKIEGDSSDPTLLFKKTSDNDTFGFLYDISEDDFHLVMRSNSDPSFLDDLMTFTPQFRVGIKEPNPTKELDVNGDVLIQGELETENGIIIGGTIQTDTITENTGSAGVTIEGVQFEDSDIYIDNADSIFFGNTNNSITSEASDHLDLYAEDVIDMNTNEVRVHGAVVLSQTEVTISSGGAITVSRNNHRVDTYVDAATDNLDTINGGQSGQILILRTVNNGRDITIRDEVGNIKLSGGNDFTMDTIYDNIMLIKDTVGGGLWMEIERSNID